MDVLLEYWSKKRRLENICWEQAVLYCASAFGELDVELQWVLGSHPFRAGILGWVFSTTIQVTVCPAFSP